MVPSPAQQGFRSQLSPGSTQGPPPVLVPPELEPPEVDPPEVDPPEVRPPEADPPELEPPEVAPLVVVEVSVGNVQTLFWHSRDCVSGQQSPAVIQAAPKAAQQNPPKHSVPSQHFTSDEQAAPLEAQVQPPFSQSRPEQQSVEVVQDSPMSWQQRLFSQVVPGPVWLEPQQSSSSEQVAFSAWQVPPAQELLLRIGYTSNTASAAVHR